MTVLAAVAVPNAMAFRLEDSGRLTPTGVTGQPYYHALPTSAGCKGVYMFVQRGELPPGLRLVGNKRDDVDGSDWRIEGIPTTPGTYGFELELRNLCPADSVQEVLEIRIVQGLAIQGGGLPVGTVGQAYPTQQLTATGGGNHTWSIASGSLPAGLTLSSSGVISGTPTEAAQARPVTIRVSDGGRFTTRYYEVSIRAPLGIAPVTVPPVAQVNQPYGPIRLVATGGSGRVQWSLVSGVLPSGVTLDPATGVIQGTPTQGGAFPIRVRATDTEGRTVEAGLTIQIASPVSITTRRFAALKVGRSYVLQIKTLGGVPIVRNGVNTMNWKVVSGKLPLGLRLNTRTGKLIGIPRRAGVYAFSIQVTDKFKNTDVESYVLTVKK